MTEQTADKKFIKELLIGCEHDGSYIPVGEVERLMLRAVEIARESMYNQGRKDAMRDCEKNQCQKFEKLKNVQQQTAEKIFEELEEYLPVTSRESIFKEIKSRWVGDKKT